MQSGDGAVLVEIGEQNLFFRTRLIAELWERRLRKINKDGIYAYIPGVASLLIKFHPEVISVHEILDLLVSNSEGLAQESLDQVVPSRRVHLPVVFNDSGSQAVIERYMQSTGRKKAAYLPSNIEYMAKANGFSSVEDIESTFCSADWYVLSRCFFSGLPMIAPFDMRCVFKSQKYKYAYPPSDMVLVGQTEADLSPAARLAPTRRPGPWGTPVSCRRSTPSASLRFSARRADLTDEGRPKQTHREVTRSSAERSRPGPALVAGTAKGTNAFSSCATLTLCTGCPCLKPSS